MTTFRPLARALACAVVPTLLLSAAAGAAGPGGSRVAPTEGAPLSGLPPAATPVAPPIRLAAAGLEKIKHIVIVVQENRSFDHYFGTFPGADGIPMKANGVPSVCIKNPHGGHCIRPYHDVGQMDSGGPHHQTDANFDINGGKMNGFLQRAVDNSRNWPCSTGDPHCTPGTALPDVMGYKTAQDIPNYWAYASDYVLQDHMFEPVRSWSLPSHLYLVSGWSARCSNPYDPMSCTSASAQPPKSNYFHDTPLYAWTDVTYLLHREGISWRYYVGNGTPVDCGDGRNICGTPTTTTTTPMIWNPLQYFTDVQQNLQVGNVQHNEAFFGDLKRGKLAQVSWVTPDQIHSEHAPQATIADGQAWVTKVVNAVMRSKAWGSTAIFVTWDDWGGFYDHMVPPKADSEGYGLRVPGLLISPYAKRGYIDHQVLSFDAYLKFIEDVFLGGQRLDPKNDGRPDSRPMVRENAPILGDLAQEFDFAQPPRKPEILSPHPKR